VLKLKTHYGDGTSQLEMTPLEFIRHLAVVAQARPLRVLAVSFVESNCTVCSTAMGRDVELDALKTGHSVRARSNGCWRR
jgi:hypothetical protein